jgi:imidazole glycerol-phosphate synthase subunit HisF
MLSRRIVVCLDVAGQRVVKGVEFESLRDVGDPVELALRYEVEGADEIVFLDIGATAESRATILDVARRTAEGLFIPLTIGGGIRTADDVGKTLRSGADKVSINSAAVSNPSILTESANRFGAQCVVASIDARKEDGGWVVYTSGGRVRTSLEPVSWAIECVNRGAGEILLTSIDRDGTRDGYDLGLTRRVADSVHVPVVASGGAGNASHVVEVLKDGHADAALLAGILHDRETTVAQIKSVARAAGLRMRAAA